MTKIIVEKNKTDEIFADKVGVLPISEKSKVGCVLSNLQNMHVREFILTEVATFL